MLGKKSFSNPSTFSFQVHSEYDHASTQLSEQLKRKAEEVPIDHDLVIICIGTDRSTGDSLGPLIGSALKKEKLSNFYVYGTLADPVHAVNLDEKLETILHLHKDPFIIAIDACLGRLKNIGKITFSEGPVVPGAAMKKKLPNVGDMHITGIVNVSGLMEYFVLQNTRLHTVMTMAECVSKGFLLADKKMKNRQVSLSFQRDVESKYRSHGFSKSETAFSLQDDIQNEGFSSK